MRIYEELELAIAIVLTLLAKWLMTEEPPKKTDSDFSKRLRRRRSYGGIIAGGIVAFYGHTILINHVEILTEEARIPIVIALTISGEHVFRALITKLPEWIQMFVEKRIK